MAKLTIFGKERERIDYYYPWFDGMSLPEQRRLLASVRQEIADEHAAIQAARPDPDRSQPDQPPPAKPAASSDASSSQQKKSKRRHYGSGRRRYRGWRRR